MFGWAPGAFTALIGQRALHAGAMSVRTPFHRTFFKSPLVQGGTFGVGYTGGSYLGYGGSNTWDPFGIHNKSSNTRPTSLTFRMPYGYYGRRYGGYRRRYSRFRRYRGYRRRSYYRRRYY